MNNTLKTSLVLCDLDHLLLGTDGNLPQVLRDVMQLFSSRGGRLTVFSQRSPRALPDGKKPCCKSCPQPWALASHCR